MRSKRRRTIGASNLRENANAVEPEGYGRQRLNFRKTRSLLPCDSSHGLYTTNSTYELAASP